MFEKNGITIYENNEKTARFYISYVSEECSTGILFLAPGASLSKHNRPHAIENLTQISGTCLMTLFDKQDDKKEIVLGVGEGIRMDKGEYHIHANPYKEESITLWKAEGDIRDIIENIKKTNKQVNTNIPKNL